MLDLSTLFGAMGPMEQPNPAERMRCVGGLAHEFEARYDQPGGLIGAMGGSNFYMRWRGDICVRCGVIAPAPPTRQEEMETTANAVKDVMDHIMSHADEPDTETGQSESETGSTPRDHMVLDETGDAAVPEPALTDSPY